MIRALSASLTFAALLIGASEASAKIIADSGFRPARDGFSFPNYTTGYADLGPNQIRTLFGSGVCKFVTKKAGCVLIPPAERYLKDENRDMDAIGHCYGFSTLSLLLFRGQYPAFGRGPTSSLRLQRNIALQRAIAYTFQWQTLPAVLAGRVTATPNQVLRSLIAALRRPGGETYGIGVTKPDRTGGHEITPFEVDELGAGRFDVLVYDNNYPGATRRVRFDTRRNTWSYQAAINPRERSGRYQGNARTKSVMLDPTTPGLGVHPCPFCAPRKGQRGSYNELRLEGNPYSHAHLLIVDSRGRQLGYVNGRLVSEIPGGRAIFPIAFADWRERQEPIYRIPANLNVSVAVDGRGLRTPDREHLSLIGPGHDVAIDDLRIRPGERNTFVVSASAGSFAYTSASGQPQSPTFDMGLMGSRGDFRFRLKALSLNPASTVTAAIDRRRATLTFRDVGAAAQTFQVALTRYLKDRLQVLQTRTIRLRPGQRATVSYGKLRPGQRTIPITVGSAS